jgi:hypothetical protein
MPSYPNGPLELAEAYFELPDLLTDEKGIERMKLFRGGLVQQMSELEKNWQQYSDEWETSSDRKALLQKLQAYCNKRRYLSSMISDLEKKIGSDRGNRWH